MTGTQPDAATVSLGTFHTPEYAATAGRWEEAHEQLGLPLVPVFRPSLGAWNLNCGQKPGAVLEALDRCGTDWLVWLDCDSLLLAVPPLPAPGAWDVGLVRNPHREHVNRISAGSFVFGNTAGACRFLERWAGLCAADPGIDHCHLTSVVASAGIMGFARLHDLTVVFRWISNALDPVKRPVPGLAQ